MDPQYFELFLTIVEVGNLSAAGRAMHFSRAVISERLMQLERQLGTQLFVREVGGRALVLTPAGRAFLPIAQQYRDLRTTLDEAVTRFVRAQEAPVFRLGVTSSGYSYLAPGITQKLVRRDPELKLQITTVPWREVTEAVESCSFDAAIVFMSVPYLPKSPFYRGLPFFEEDRCIVCPADTPLPDRVLTPADLDPRFEVVYPGSRVTAKWRRENFPPGAAPYCEVSSVLLAYKYLTDPRCWTILPVGIARDLLAENKGLTTRQVRPALPTRACSLLLSTAYPRQDTVQMFLDCCREFLAERPWMRSRLPEEALPAEGK